MHDNKKSENIYSKEYYSREESGVMLTQLQNMFDCKRHTRKACLDDGYIRNAASKDPVLQDVFEDAAQKMNIVDMQKIARDTKSDPSKFARKVEIKKMRQNRNK